MSSKLPPATKNGRPTPSTYVTYLRIDELLDLQKRDGERLHPDELIFQIVHQTFELWWKMHVEQMALASVCYEEGRYGEAERALRPAR
jgi:tryptophan 2,3-dioxygenase